LGRFAIVRLRLAACWAFLMFRLAASVCFFVAMTFPYPVGREVYRL
jgi:hypothetical protein